MPSKPESYGACAYCNEIITKRSVAKHLQTCQQRLDVLQAAEANDRPVETLWHLRVQDAYAKEFWLHLEMRGSASLTTFDRYLHTRIMAIRCRCQLTQVGYVWL